jgi:mono/diheme cytochrome c family protein
VLVLLLAGCDQKPARFEPNRVFVRQQKLAEDLSDFGDPDLQRRIDEMHQLLELLFGTPDQPRLPQLVDQQWDGLLDLARLKQAAGPVGGDPAAGTGGLYRQYCAQCHGITGDGAGPLARLQDPYPRDFRRGIFKFKSTRSTGPPLDSDLQRILDKGIPDTGMPDFAALEAGQRTALIDYVKYLSIRGMFERDLIREVALELDEQEPLVQWDQRKQNPDRFEQSLDPWRYLLQYVTGRWRGAEQAVLPVPETPADWRAASRQARGRALFFSTATNCAECHGNTALGDGQTDEYDEWSKELEPSNAAALADYLALGALPPRRVTPRNLRVGVYRGSVQPQDFFRRMKNGIAGTTMPTIATEMSDADIWCLVAYVLALPEDSLTDDVAKP